MLITFEGINGCGKTTQLQNIYKYFTENKIPVMQTKEPSSLGGAIRRLLIEKSSIHQKTRLLIFQADRNENIHKNIIPAIANKKIVLCDRFVDSTVAYQVYGNGLDPQLVLGLNKVSSNKISPNLTFFIDISVEEATRRNKSRTDRSTRHDYTYEYLQRVREGYIEIASHEPRRIITIDGNRLTSVVTREILHTILSRFNPAAESLKQ